MVLPRHAREVTTAGGGTYFIPNTVGMVNGAPHADAARTFVEFMLTPETERQLAAMPAKHAPLVHPTTSSDFVVPDPLVIPPQFVAAQSDAAVDAFFAAVRAVAEEK
jgi:ABC-type Fe3+ transport system substrate-binding protein